jgi:hypothetical protein
MCGGYQLIVSLAAIIRSRTFEVAMYHEGLA